MSDFVLKTQRAGTRDSIYNIPNYNNASSEKVENQKSGVTRVHWAFETRI